MYPYPPTVILVRRRPDYFQCIQLGKHFRTAVGEKAPDIAQIDAARAAGEKVSVIDHQPSREVWSYPGSGHRPHLHIAVDREQVVRRLYIA